MDSAPICNLSYPPGSRAPRRLLGVTNVSLQCYVLQEIQNYLLQGESTVSEKKANVNSRTSLFDNVNFSLKATNSVLAQSPSGFTVHRNTSLTEFGKNICRICPLRIW